MNRKNKILIICFSCIVVFILFKLLPIGYDVIHVRYDFNGQNKVVNLGAPKFSFLIKNNELIYYRKDISFRSNKLEIPNESHFVVRNNKLILKDDYLDKYKKGIILD